MRIAVADDEPLIRQYFQEMLTDLGHEVVVAAASGRELVAGCEAHQPDLVISDIRMNDISGIAATREIAARRWIPAILVSAYHDDDLIREAQEAPVLAYLVKPIERADLETAIAIVARRFDQFQALRQEADSLRQALEDRKLIERAKGLLMQQTGLSEPDAFRRMQKVASERNLKLAEVARRMLTAAEVIGPPGERRGGATS